MYLFIVIYKENIVCAINKKKASVVGHQVLSNIISVYYKKIRVTSGPFMEHAQCLHNRGSSR